MPLGQAKGLDFASFSKLVKTMTLAVIDGTGVVMRVLIPLESFDRRLMVTQNPTQKGPQRGPHLIEIKITYNRITRQINIEETPQMGDAIIFKGIIHEALRVFDESLAKAIVAPPPTA